MSVEMIGTTAPATAAEPSTAPPEDREYRFSVEQYLAMTEHGILTASDRVELLEGRIIRKMGKNPPHVVATLRTLYTFIRILPPGWTVTKEDPVRLAASVPEPDIMIFRGAIEDYLERIVETKDVPLVVEVADSSYDQDIAKGRIYAANAIPVYWLMDLRRRRIELHEGPTGTGEAARYRTVRLLGPEDEIPVVIEGREVARLPVRDLLP